MATRFLCGRMNSVLGLIASLHLASAENWPGWRGPRGDGTSLESKPPIHWSANSNVVWKTELPGNGHASPHRDSSACLFRQGQTDLSRHQ